jgi:hypothetical protein
MEYVAYFFAGAFLCNCVPHLVCGVQGSSFPTPFAKPHGVGLSSPLMNFAWGFFNLIVGLLLLWKWPVQIGLNASFLVFLVGVGVIGAFTSVHFGKVRSNRMLNGK